MTEINQSYHYDIFCKNKQFTIEIWHECANEYYGIFFLSKEKTYNSTFIAGGDKIFLCLSSFSWIHIVVDG